MIFFLALFSSEPNCHVVCQLLFNLMAPWPAGKCSKLNLQRRSHTNGAKLDDVVTAPPGDTIGPDVIVTWDPHVLTEAVVALGNTAAAKSEVVLTKETVRHRAK
jgi:hypothetical protein